MSNDNMGTGMIVRTESGFVRTVFSPQAKNIRNWGDLQELSDIPSNGYALLVAIDGTAKRITMGDLRDWLQAQVNGHVPYISQTGAIMVWDSDTMEFEDSGFSVSGFVTQTAMASALGGYVTSSALSSQLSDYVTTQDLNVALGDIEALLADL